jgi:hypothetical protein
MKIASQLPGGDKMDKMERKLTLLPDALKEFEVLLKKQPDVPDSLPVFNQFIKYFLRTKTGGEPLPSVEVMTIIRNEKPNVFYLLRKQSKTNVVMNMLTNVEMDLEEAKNSLDRLKRKIG